MIFHDLPCETRACVDGQAPTYKWFNFRRLQMQFTISRNHTWNFDFGSIPGPATCRTKFSRDAGQWQPTTAHSQPTITRVNNRHSHNHSVPRLQCNIQ